MENVCPECGAELPGRVDPYPAPGTPSLWMSRLAGGILASVGISGLIVAVGSLVWFAMNWEAFEGTGAPQGLLMELPFSIFYMMVPTIMGVRTIKIESFPHWGPSALLEISAFVAFIFVVSRPASGPVGFWFKVGVGLAASLMIVSANLFQFNLDEYKTAYEMKHPKK